jgi:hypothetical protein
VLCPAREKPGSVPSSAAVDQRGHPAWDDGERQLNEQYCWPIVCDRFPGLHWQFPVRLRL